MKTKVCLKYFVSNSRYRIFVKRYGSFAGNMGRYIGKNISKILSDKCSRKLLA